MENAGCAGEEKGAEAPPNRSHAIPNRFDGLGGVLEVETALTACEVFAPHGFKNPVQVARSHS
jgi:hypothetical protein